MGKSLLGKIIFQVAEVTLFLRLYLEMQIHIVSYDDFIENYTKLSFRKHTVIALLEIVNMWKIMMFYDFSIIFRCQNCIFLAKLETKNAGAFP